MQTQSTITSKPQFTWLQLAIRFIVIIAIFAAVLFGTAGKLDWWMGWAYLSIFGLSFWGRAVVMSNDPDLIEERAHSLGKENVKSWDRVLMPLVALVLPIILLSTAGLDVRFGWTMISFPLSVHLAAWIIVVAGTVIINRAMAENHFFSGTVRIQDDRNHTVCTTGPYSIVRHPGYSGAILANIAIPFLLGSLWALVPAIITCLLFVVRTSLEDTTLQLELPGYLEYTQQTKFRLIPGIW